MNETIILLIVAILALVVGIVAGKFIFKAISQHKILDAESQAQKIVKDEQLQAETLIK